MMFSTEWPQFYTATILNWQPLLTNNKYKDIIIECLQFRVNENNVKLYSFVIMSNHIHLQWQPLNPFTKAKLQHSFMTYTFQKIKEDLKLTNPALLKCFKVNAKDRAYQLWKRNALSVDLFTSKVLQQKIEYIHANPVKAGLCLHSEAYYYSSARFYDKL